MPNIDKICIMCINIEKIHTEVFPKESAMRTNIVVDDDLMAEAMKLCDIKTKKGVIDQALNLLVQVKKQEKIRKLRGKLHWEGDLEKLRVDR